MTDRLSPNLLPEKQNSPHDIETQRENRRRRYVERLGDNLTINLQRIMPGDGAKWDEVGQLRRKVYVDDRGYLTAESVDEQGREYDEYDDAKDTVHICATDEAGHVVGYVRILTKGENGETLLPAEKAFGVNLSDKAFEISRLISDREFAGGPLVTLALIRALMHEVNADSEKYGEAVATLEPFLALHLDNMGIPINTIAGIQETPEYNSSNMLVEMDYTKIVERATEMDKERKFSPVYPERLGPWFDDMKKERGLGRIALVEARKEAA